MRPERLRCRYPRFVPGTILVCAFSGGLLASPGFERTGVEQDESCSTAAVQWESGWRAADLLGERSMACQFFLDDGGSLEIRLETEPGGEAALVARAIPEGNVAELRWIPSSADERSRLQNENLHGEAAMLLTGEPRHARSYGDLFLRVDDAIVVVPGAAPCSDPSPQDEFDDSDAALAGLRERLHRGPLQGRVQAVREYLAGPKGDSEADVVGLLLAVGGERASSTLEVPGLEWRAYEGCLRSTLYARDSPGTNGGFPTNEVRDLLESANHAPRQVSCLSHLFDLIERLAGELRDPG